MFVTRATLPSLLILVACTVTPPQRQEDSKQVAEQVAKTEQVEPAKTDTPPAPNPATALTAEEIALIEADPKTLTPDQNRKRAHALRKKIMQNPNSEAAKTLEEARQAVLAGEIDPKSKPKADNGVVIPAPEYLKNPDQSYGQPDLSSPP